MARLQGKVALITGGARGMGGAEARLFAKEGARVVIGDILEDDGRQLEYQIMESGGEALFVQLDVTSEKAWKRAIAATVSRFGKLDILVNNAGIRGRTGEEDAIEENWDQVMEVNAKGVYLGIKLVVPEMRKFGGGSIVNTSSQMGIVGSATGNLPYHASKGAVRILSKAFALRCAKDNIRVNSVYPGPILTPMTQERLEVGGKDHSSYVARVPLGRIGKPEEVAYGVLYLASDEASFVTGAELVIDGGWVAQ